MKVAVICDNTVGVALVHELAKLGFETKCLHMGKISMVTHYVRPIPVNEKLLRGHIVGFSPDVIINMYADAVPLTCLIGTRTLYISAPDPIITTGYTARMEWYLQIATSSGQSVAHCGIFAASFKYNAHVYPSRALTLSTRGEYRFRLSSFKTMMRFVVRWIMSAGARSDTVLINKYCWRAQDILAISGYANSKFEPRQIDFGAMETTDIPASVLFGENQDHTVDELQSLYEL